MTTVSWENRMKIVNSMALTVTTTLFLNGPARDPIFQKAPESPLRVGTAPSDGALADLKGDRKLDIVTISGAWISASFTPYNRDRLG
jgi:hypothetical protein